MSGSPIFWLPAASTEGARTDHLFFLLCGISTLIVLLVLTLIVTFAIRYRHGSAAPRGRLPEFFRSEFEIGWTAATAFLFLFIFWWASAAQLAGYAPPPDAIEMHVTAKQWMFKTQQPNGAREINQLHMPVDTPVRLVMTSQDVIHSFWVPAFRFKRDILPGRVTQGWFQATRTGTFHLFCAEYCGTDHSEMGGEVIVMPKADYAAWTAAQPEGDDLGKAGGKLFVKMGCAGCHAGSNAVHAPNLAGLWGRTIPLADGSSVEVDERYVRDSILQPRREIAAGYEPIMPSFQGVASEADLTRLVAYIRSLATGEDAGQ
ncbi:cytochrome c oxidase subunit II [Mangrovibrevibacter kandeliae]|uniref:cytochrome c oxidase subunit II n=1 Tax=Mangrovibrevibacter kandeliae TaxID=2968473 RepID=UPI002117B180|nr:MULTISPECIES: cytochrome c oxidase subunit II [unclassified Aurantimonas]MCQ8783990.1 cytochrome c oxidase subunit II [Aurantimonas sp. CSK15Z-1]MCW4116707.1 cytochrome c oxidase subunit II [Aurantimonas sp. MSK8Z-1]